MEDAAFRDVSMKRVKREGEHVLIYCSRPAGEIRPGRRRRLL